MTRLAPPAEPEDAIDAPSGIDATASPADKARFTLLFVSHAIIDVFPILFVTLMLPLREGLNLTELQERFVYMATPIFSGALQPIFARLTDKYDTRLCGPLGLVIGAVCVGSIGLAQNFWQLAVLQVIGVIGVGMYHPITTALAGQAGSRWSIKNGSGRALAIAVFISGGMLGHAIGPVIGSWINDAYGMTHLVWLIPPSLLIAIWLHVALRKTPHRHGHHAELRAGFDDAESMRRWGVIGVLTLQNALRFTTNVGMFLLFNTWMESKIQDNPALAAKHVGYLISAMTLGMGVAVLFAGRLSRKGRELAPLFWLSMIGAAFVATLGLVGDALVGDAEPTAAALIPMYACAALTSVGFFATFPIATSLAQRLQPGHTSLVTALMMGVGWSFSALHAPLGVLFFGGVNLNEAASLPPERINNGFFGFAALLVVAGVLTLFIPRQMVRDAASAH